MSWFHVPDDSVSTMFLIFSRVCVDINVYFVRHIELKTCCLYRLYLWCQIIRTVFKHIITCVQECHMWMRHFQEWNLSLTSAVLKDSVMSFTKKQNFVSNQENSPKSPFEFDLLCVFPLVIDSQWQSATPCSLFEWIQWRDDVAHHWWYRQAHIVLLLADARR